MSNIAIKAENLSKAYQLGEIGTGTISRDFERWVARVRGKEDPFLRIGEANDRTSKGISDVVWSLKDVNFEIEQGDAVGIIGRNGAGKSTLLKILSKVTSPTTGKISGKGRIASLLEVGTGFHPELTGRENIYLNGAILGMRKREIARKFDEIVDFAGIERYIDTPVKRYSSGMYVRLAFAVAAHLESEILIVDEVLAVGDAEFQKKCLGKMGDVSKGEGRTVLFVSHNMGSVKQLCTKGLLLNRGSIIENNDIKTVTDQYSNLEFAKKEGMILNSITHQHSNLTVTSFTLNGSTSTKLDMVYDTLNIEISGLAKQQFEYNFEVRLFTLDHTLISLYSPAHLNGEIKKIDSGSFKVNDSILIPKQMTNGTFILNISLSYPNVETYLLAENIQLTRSSLKTITGRNLDYNNVGFFVMERNAG